YCLEFLGDLRVLREDIRLIPAVGWFFEQAGQRSLTIGIGTTGLHIKEIGCADSPFEVAVSHKQHVAWRDWIVAQQRQEASSRERIDGRDLRYVSNSGNAEPFQKRRRQINCLDEGLPASATLVASGNSNPQRRLRQFGT